MNEERPLTRIRVAGVPEHFNLPWMLALERRAFVRAGLDIQWRTVPEGTGAMCGLLDDGSVDVALLVTEGAVRYALNGAPVRILSSYVDTPLTWGVHVGAGSPITGPERMKGCRFAISRLNSGSHLAALAYTHAQGWSAQKSDFILVHDLKGAVERLKEADPVAFMWEKYTTKPLVDQGLLRLVDEFRANWPAFMIVATNTILNAHRPEVERMLNVIRDQASGLMTKRTAPEMVAHRYGLSVEDAKTWFEGTRWNTGAQLSASVLREAAESLISSGDTGTLEGLDERIAAIMFPPEKP
ncbi:MAG: ABC transporter substrate-binding protein [Flavobacteriales bacterium]|nr:ABC transporter substrate-binding protein [Flavobacteriales bacterium]